MSTTAAAAAPKPLSRPAQVATLVAQLAYGLVSMTICLPSMQEWGREFGASASQVQLTFGGFLLAYGAMQLVYGPLSDRHGRRALLMCGLALATAASFMAALASTIEVLIAARVLQGAGCAAGMVLGRAAVQDLYAGPERTRVMAYVGMAMGLCPPTATVLGGQLHTAFGWSSNFWLMGGMGFVLMALAWRGMPSRPSAPAAAADAHWLRAMGQSYARLGRERAFVLYVTVLSLTAGTFYAFLGGAPLVLGGYGIGPATVGFYIMVPPLSYIAGNFMTSRLVRRIGDRRMMVLGQGLTLAGIALVIVVAAAGWRSGWSFALPLVLVGLGHGMLIPPVLAATVGTVPALAGAAAALAGVMQQLVGALGGVAAGWVPHDGPVPLALLMFGLTLASFVAQALIPRR